MKLVMLVGFHGAGKSTLVKEYENKGYVSTLILRGRYEQYLSLFRRYFYGLSNLVN